ncbi:MAG TPA: hypothetical protein VE377_24825 [Candidatus Dormibacteraeota bacterium]|nr:hypothetical protein [Candidatus Dormibacteraeota bacterium]
MTAAVRQEVARALEARLKDQKIVEVETTQAIVARLSDWARLFGYFVAIPLAILLGVLGALGIRTYSDFTSRVGQAEKDALASLSTATETARKATEDAKKVDQEYKDLDTQLQASKQLAGQVQSLSEKVTKIEQAVKFKPSSSLTPELKQNLARVFGNYHAYLQAVGFSLGKNPPTAFVNPSVEEQTYYDPQENQIVISSDWVSFQDAGLREYTYYSLIAVNKDLTQALSLQGLESGLADYFPCSFLNRSEFAKELFESIEKKHPGFTIPPRNLDNHRSFTEIHAGQTELHDEGNIWGGAFWQLRTEIGKAPADKLLFAAWKDFRPAGRTPDPMVFPKELVKQDSALYSGTHVQQIQAIFEQRGLKF